MFKKPQEFKNLDQLCEYYGWSRALVDIALFCLENGSEHVEVMAESLNGQLYDKLFRIVLGVENPEDGTWAIKPEIKALRENKEGNSATFRELTQRLVMIPEIAEVEKEITHFFAPASKKVEAKETYNQGNYEIEKSLKVIKDFYVNRNKETTIMGLYSFLSGSSFPLAYNNFKEEVKYKGLK